MEYFIKNMVCDRCITAVENEANRLGIKVTAVHLGEMQVEQELSEEDKDKLTAALEPLGFELIDDRKSRIIEQIKNIIIKIVHQQNNALQINLSDLLSEKLHHDYNYLSNLFSEVEGRSIEKYFIAQKIEKVKELLVYDELTLSEIAFRLNYSSTAHLSSQFKKTTGLTPSHFKKIRTDKRKPIDQV